MVTPVRIMIILAAIFGAVVWIKWLVSNRKRWGYSIAPLTFFLHVIVFYIVLNTDHGLSSLDINLWSNTIRFQGIFTLIIGGITMYHISRRS